MNRNAEMEHEMVRASGLSNARNVGATKTNPMGIPLIEYISSNVQEISDILHTLTTEIANRNDRLFGYEPPTVTANGRGSDDQPMPDDARTMLENNLRHLRSIVERLGNENFRQSQLL